MSGSLNPCGRPEWSSSTCFQPGPAPTVMAIWGSEPVHGRTLSLCLYFSVTLPLKYLNKSLKKEKPGAPPTAHSVCAETLCFGLPWFLVTTGMFACPETVQNQYHSYTVFNLQTFLLNLMSSSFSMYMVFFNSWIFS